MLVYRSDVAAKVLTPTPVAAIVPFLMPYHVLSTMLSCRLYVPIPIDISPLPSCPDT